MRAIVQDTTGPANVLRIADVPVPEIGANDVLVEVRAVGIDLRVVRTMRGLPDGERLRGRGARTPRTRVPGTDFAGIRCGLGDEVTRFRPGDVVYGTGGGTFAEYTVTSEERVAPMPSTLPVVP